MAEALVDLPAAPVDPVSDRVWVVAVGASAGGLESLERFFSAVQGRTHAAFVVIQHLAPDHRSMMPELLARHAHLPVREAVAGDVLEADHIYLMPPGIVMTLEHERLVFAPRPLHGIALPIDAFFRSLAGEGAARSIGIVLSGSGSDGAAGAAALRAAGGYAMAQAPDTARFDSMPRSLMAATSVDAVMPPEGLAAQVLALTQGRAGRLGDGALIQDTHARTALQRLFDALMQHAGIDFSSYKLPTLMRRIERRMNAASAQTLIDYADIVEASADEREALRSELLIPVTGFFRDPAAFDALGLVLQDLLRQHPLDRPLRLWSAGCATGEEAYSLAILAMEACAAVNRWPGFKVFATDVDQRFLGIGSAGNYPAGAAETLTPSRLAQWFLRQDERLQVKPELRQSVLFARHNLLEDAPFTHMDVVVCRNTLIYFQAEAQDRVMRRLQYALTQKALLFLGSSESLGNLQPDFQALDAAHKIYRLVRPVLTSLAVREGFGRSTVALRGRSQPVAAGTPPVQPLVELACTQLVQAYAPLSLLISGQRRLLHAWGPTQRFLRVPEGEARLDAVHLLPPQIGAVASHAMHAAQRKGAEHRSPPLITELDGETLTLQIVARPLAGQEPDGDCLLLSVETVGTGTVSPEAPLSAAEVDRLSALEQELEEARASLRKGMQELETTNEELQATNEELMSSNEERQSTNEELQSVNEELYTVNAEYNAKLDAVSALNADLDGMSQSTGIATLFVDQQLQLLRFTPEAALLFRLRPSDLGRDIGSFSNPLNYPELLDDLRRALAGEAQSEREVFGPAGQLYLARVVGYGDRPGGMRRAVISLIDVSRLRDIQRLQAVIDSFPAHVAVLDVHGTIRQVNHAWMEFARCNGAASDAQVGVGANYLSVLAHSPTSDALDVLRGLQQVLSGQQRAYRVTYPCRTQDEDHWWVMHATALTGSERGAVVAHVDITPWHGMVQGPGTADA
jgi:two-component system CheB/CheR fusion protein